MADRLPGTGLPLAWRIFAVNAAALAVATVALAVSPATVSFPIALTESVVLALGLVVILALNLLLVRRALAPLERLAGLMRRVDLLSPGARIEIDGPPEIAALGEVFNDMLERLERERRESGRDALRALEAERQRVARELHDEVGQALTAVMLQLSRLARDAPAESRSELVEAQEQTRHSLDEIRRIAQRLRPEALDDLGLVPALNALTAGFAELSGLRIRRRLDETVPPLPRETELVIFRVAQESLTNAARHSGADEVQVTLAAADGRVVLRVRDEGTGVGAGSAGGGIRGMRERALLVGGRLRVTSPSSGGTEVELIVPAEGE